jgi:hypothetical protein
MSDHAPVLLHDLASAQQHVQELCTAFAMLHEVREGKTSQGKRYIDLSIGDQSSTVAGKVWEDKASVQDAAVSLPTGRAVKILFKVGTYQGAIQLNVVGLREVSDEDRDSYRPESVFGEGIHLIEDLLCETLVFDIETVPAWDRRALPNTIAESLVKYADRREMEPGAVMGLSPFFGKIVSLAFGDGEQTSDQQKIHAMVVLPDGADPDDCPDWMLPMTETDLLQAFWTLAGAARTVVTYNGRGFDVPFLIHRSLIHGVPARVDLMSNRFSLRPHLDLLQVVRQGSFSTGPNNLDVVCWALGIESPKETMDGSMVAPAYESGRIEDIARYNLADVRATTDVYWKLRDGLLQYRKDW